MKKYGIGDIGGIILITSFLLFILYIITNKMIFAEIGVLCFCTSAILIAINSRKQNKIVIPTYVEEIIKEQYNYYEKEQFISFFQIRFIGKLSSDDATIYDENKVNPTSLKKDINEIIKIVNDKLEERKDKTKSIEIYCGIAFKTIIIPNKNIKISYRDLSFIENIYSTTEQLKEAISALTSIEIYTEKNEIPLKGDYLLEFIPSIGKIYYNNNQLYIEPIESYNLLPKKLKIDSVKSNELDKYKKLISFITKNAEDIKNKIINYKISKTDNELYKAYLNDRVNRGLIEIETYDISIKENHLVLYFPYDKIDIFTNDASKELNVELTIHENDYDIEFKYVDIEKITEANISKDNPCDNNLPFEIFIDDESNIDSNNKAIDLLNKNFQKYIDAIVDEKLEICLEFQKKEINPLEINRNIVFNLLKVSEIAIDSTYICIATYKDYLNLNILEDRNISALVRIETGEIEVKFD